MPLRHSGFDTLHYSGVTDVRINGFDGVDSFFFSIEFHLLFTFILLILLYGCLLPGVSLVAD